MINNINPKYKFISFEGIEGSGKTTQTKLLQEFFLHKGQKSILSREPGGTKVAEQIREILIQDKFEKLDGITELLLNFAARKNHVENLIKPTIKKNQIVICDRFFDSSLAYQGYGFGTDLSIIEQIKKITLDSFTPDITFFIDISIKTMQQRINGRAGNNKYEKMPISFHKKIRNGFLEIQQQNSQRIIKINGNKTAETIHQEIIKILTSN